MFKINGVPATGVQAELHYMNWCLALEQEHSDVPHNALDAGASFQRGVFRGDQAELAKIKLSGVKVFKEVT